MLRNMIFFAGMASIFISSGCRSTSDSSVKSDDGSLIADEVEVASSSPAPLCVGEYFIATSGRYTSVLRLQDGLGPNGRVRGTMGVFQNVAGETVFGETPVFGECDSTGQVRLNRRIESTHDHYFQVFAGQFSLHNGDKSIRGAYTDPRTLNNGFWIAETSPRRKLAEVRLRRLPNQPATVIDLPACGVDNPPTRSISLEVSGNARIESLQVTYELTGMTEELHVRENFNANSSTRKIDLQGERRCIDKITIEGQSSQLPLARVTVFSHR